MTLQHSALVHEICNAAHKRREGYQRKYNDGHCVEALNKVGRLNPSGSRCQLTQGPMQANEILVLPESICSFVDFDPTIRVVLADEEPNASNQVVDNQDARQVL